MNWVRGRMKYLVTAVLICGCHVQSTPMEPLSPSPQPTLILVFPAAPEPAPAAFGDEEGTPEVWNTDWECFSKNHCPESLVCCGQANLGSSCREHCDSGVVSTLCETDAECNEEIPGVGILPGMSPDDPLCVPMENGPPGIKTCVMG